MSEAEPLPSELREHISAEQLRPEADLFRRSLFSIVRVASTPYCLVTAVIILAYLQIFSPTILILFSLPLLLAAQRCFQTLVHDLSHKLFSLNTATNDLLGNLLVAGWTGASVPAYRAIHLRHHKYNGSAQDPEHISFAVVRSRGGLLRHCLRYIAGLEAFRLINKYYGKSKAEDGIPMQVQPAQATVSKTHIVICQLILAGIFTVMAQAWYLYFIWLYLAISWNPMLSNLRFLVEHPGETDLTISTPSNLLERLYFAPFNFNFHLEHHLWPNLPPYHLASAHRYLQQQGYFDRHPKYLGSGFISALRGRH